MRRALLLVMVMASGMLAASAGAATLAPTLRLSLMRTFTVDGSAVTVVGRPVLVRGAVAPAAPGQTVTVRSWVGARRLSSRQVTVGPDGTFALWLISPVAGPVRVSASHAATSTLVALSATARFVALAGRAQPGSYGPLVTLIQQRLTALHVYVPRSGVFDQGTALALDAYHRLLRWGHATTLDRPTLLALLDGRGTFPLRYPADGRHAEGNLGLQLLALIDRGQVQLIFPISSGKPSTPTVLGRFRVYRKVPGYLPDGMYYSSFFYGGYAIHGYDPAPDYPASHGCMRLPISDALTVYSWLAVGDGVDTYL